MIKSSPMLDVTQEMMLPGEIEHRTALARQENGIPISPGLHKDLAALG